MTDAEITAWYMGRELAQLNPELVTLGYVDWGARLDRMPADQCVAYARLGPDEFHAWVAVGFSAYQHEHRRQR